MQNLSFKLRYVVYAVINLQYLTMNKVEHIGIAVNSIEQAGLVYAKLLNTDIYKTEEVVSEHVKPPFYKPAPTKLNCWKLPAPIVL